EALAAAAARPMPPGPHAPASAAMWVSALALEGMPEPAAAATVQPRDVRALVDDALQGGTRADRFGLATQTLDGGPILVRERFEEPEDRRGLPAILARKSAYDAERIVVLVDRPSDAWSAALAGDLLAQSKVDAVVIAQVEEPAHGAFIETAAHAAARGLA